jgi:MFS family permease
MFNVLTRSWALFLGMLLLMVGNGFQGTLLGIRGSIEGFSTTEMSLVMSAYFVGFLGGSRLAPEMIRRVGHVRVFAALGSMVSAVLILFPVLVDPIAWFVLRVVIGFCFSGVYVTAESWLNNSVTNETRGQALSLYMVVQMLGIVTAQGLLTLGDPSGYVLFVIPSVLVSLAFAPILLSVSPTPAFEMAKPMGFREIFVRLPLSCMGMLLTGGVFSGMFGMSAVYGAEAGFSVPQISMFVSVIYVGGLLCQFPIGALSDRIDRRKLIVVVSAVGAAAAVFGVVANDFRSVLVAAFLIGGMSNPLYALLIAHANDHLETDGMAAASGRLVFLNGIGAIAGPLVTGWLMAVFGPPGFFMVLAALLVLLAVYAGWRMTRRPSPSAAMSTNYVPVLPSASPMTVDVLTEWQSEQNEADRHAAAAAAADKLAASKAV